MLASSGIVELEDRVLSFLYAHAGSVKLLATLDDLGRLLTVRRERGAPGWEPAGGGEVGHSRRAGSRHVAMACMDCHLQAPGC
jgi:hypothetical protein